MARRHVGGAENRPPPFHAEHLALRHAETHDVPVPHVHAAHIGGDTLTMLIDDLGDASHEAADDDGTTAIIAVHHIPAAPPSAMTVDDTVMRAMPTQIGRRTAHLDRPDLDEALNAVDQAAPWRAEGAHTPPYGMCHSEWHPTSMHISLRGSYILDLARSFTGPGLLDLASWPGTIDTPDVDRVAALIDTYITHGGPRHANNPRGGLDAASWALGWHRVWVADWFAEQIERGWADGNQTVWADAIACHLTEAATLLKT